MTRNVDVFFLKPVWMSRELYSPLYIRISNPFAEEWCQWRQINGPQKQRCSLDMDGSNLDKLLKISSVL